MNTTLQLRLRITTHRITIHATGPLTVQTAHLLTKTVAGTLRRYTAPVLEIDLTGITAFDDVGDIALQDCAYETTRRGILLTITTPPPISIAHRRNSHTRASAAGARRSRWWPTFSRTGTICRYRTISR